METEPTADQMKAIKALERAFVKCYKEKVHFHNHYGKIEENVHIIQKSDNLSKGFKKTLQDDYAIKPEEL